MRPFTETISLDEARRRLEAAMRPVDRIEHVPIADAAGRVAAVDVVSGVNVPPFARSAMDGYALVAADTLRASQSAPARLRLVDRIYTAQISAQAVTRGTCAEVATGAPLPEGADAVAMVEETSPGGDGAIHINATAAAGQNIGRIGADVAAGDTIAHAGDLITPGRLGTLAAIGLTTIDVYARPRVAVFSSGNEVVEPGQPLAPGQIYDVNRYTLGAVVAAHGGVAEFYPPAQDTVEAIGEALDRCRDADIVICSGGSSVGERDLIIDVVRARGEVIFHGIAVKPGKPTVFARLGSAAFFGMPGNPTSCLSNAYILLVSFLRATARFPPYVPRTVQAPLARRIVSTADRHEFHTVRLRDGQAVPAFKGSSHITSLSEADGYIEIETGTKTVEAGTLVEVKLF